VKRDIQTKSSDRFNERSGVLHLQQKSRPFTGWRTYLSLSLCSELLITELVIITVLETSTPRREIHSSGIFKLILNVDELIMIDGDLRVLGDWGLNEGQVGVAIITQLTKACTYPTSLRSR
jgi:hypothetical protein